MNTSSRVDVVLAESEHAATADEQDTIATAPVETPNVTPDPSCRTIVLALTKQDGRETAAALGIDPVAIVTPRSPHASRGIVADEIIEVPGLDRWSMSGWWRLARHSLRPGSSDPMSRLVRRIDWSPESSRQMIAVTGEPEVTGPGIRRLFTRGPIWIIARRWVLGTGPVPDRDGSVRLRRRRGHVEFVARPRVARIPKGHPWRERIHDLTMRHCHTQRPADANLAPLSPIRADSWIVKKSRVGPGLPACACVPGGRMPRRGPDPVVLPTWGSLVGVTSSNPQVHILAGLRHFFDVRFFCGDSAQRVEAM